MTETLGRSDFVAQMRVLAHRIGRGIGRLGFGLVVVIALGIALVATTFIGLLLALAALFLTLSRRRAPAAPAGSQSGATLDAHRTADGWVIESKATGWR
jgi:hypothetical protein